MANKLLHTAHINQSNSRISQLALNNGFHFLALMKGSGLPELMGYIPLLERVHIIAGHVLAPCHESPEENRDVFRLDGYERLRRIGIAHFPSAFPNQPIHERRECSRQRFVNGPLRDLAFSIWMRHRKRYHARLFAWCFASFQCDVDWLACFLVSLNFGRECGIHRVLNRFHCPKAMAEVYRRDAFCSQIRAKLLIENDVGAPESIDRLLGIADQKQLALPGPHLAPFGLIRIIGRQDNENLGLHRIEARHFLRNPASGRVMQKLGMQQEGVERDWVIKWDRFESLAVYSILEPEWRATRPRT